MKVFAGAAAPHSTASSIPALHCLHSLPCNAYMSIVPCTPIYQLVSPLSWAARRNTASSRACSFPSQPIKECSVDLGSPSIKCTLAEHTLAENHPLAMLHSLHAVLGAHRQHRPHTSLASAAGS